MSVDLKHPMLSRYIVEGTRKLGGKGHSNGVEFGVIHTDEFWVHLLVSSNIRSYAARYNEGLVLIAEHEFFYKPNVLPTAKGVAIAIISLGYQLTEDPMSALADGFLDLAKKSIGKGGVIPRATAEEVLLYSDMKSEDWDY